MLNSAPELFSGTGRHRIILRHRCDERGIHPQARDTHFPFGLDVVRLDLLVGDRPVRHARPRRNRLIAGELVELVGEMAPAAAAVGHRTAADDHAIAVRARGCFFRVVAAERVALPRRIAHQAIFQRLVAIQPLVLVVLAIAPVLAPATLLEHDHRKAGLRQLLGHDAARSARTDDDEIDFSIWCVLSHGRLLQRLPAGSFES